MSKFTSMIEEMLGAKPKLTPAQQKQKQADQEMDGAMRRVAQGSKNPMDLKAANLAAKNLRAAMAVKKKPPKESVTLKKKGKVVEAEGDEVAPAPPPDPAGADPAAADAAATPATSQEEPPLTTQAEVFLVELARNALSVDLDLPTDKGGVDLTSTERTAIETKVVPENANEIKEIIAKICSEYGFSVNDSFDTKIDGLIEDLKKNNKIIALVPGSFKPPHKGHYAMIKHFFEIADETVVVISDPGPKSIRCTPVKNLHVTAQQARQILEIYTKGKPVTFITSSQPVKWVYDYVAEDTQPGQKILLGVSGKGDDAGRYVNAQKYAPDGVEVEPSIFTDSDLNISASDFRDVVDQIPQLQYSEPVLEPDERAAFISNQLSPYLPDDLNENDKYKVFDILSTLNCPKDSL